MILLKNTRARHDYEIKNDLMAGVVLTGPEVKSLRLKNGSLKGSYVKIIGEEAWLINAQINPYKYADNQDYDPKRSRKLLLTKKQIFNLLDIQNSTGFAIIPLSFQLLDNKIKLKIGVGKGRKEYEKRKKLKERDLKRELAKSYKNKNLNF